MNAMAQEWYIPKRQTLLRRGAAEVGTRVQLLANNDGLLDNMRVDGVFHARYSPFRRLEVYAEAPLVYAEKEDVVNFELVKYDGNGVGDAFSQVSFEAFSGEDWKILYNLDGAYPTGKSPYRHRVALGSGHFSVAAGQTVMKVIDPVAIFWHLGYQHSFPRQGSTGRVAPGRSARFRFGGSLSLNPRVQTSLHVTGDVISSTKVDGAPVAGTSNSLVRLGWGLDWSLGGGWRLGMDAIFGMTKSAPDATLVHGVAWAF